MGANLKMIRQRRASEMNAVGIDVSKERSAVDMMRPFGAVVTELFEASLTGAELRKLVCFLGKLPGETQTVMVTAHARFGQFPRWSPDASK